MLAAIVLFSTWVILGIPVAIVTLPWAILTHSLGPLHRWAMHVVRTGLRLARIRIDVVWQQPLDPSQHYLFLSNHVSNLDPPILLPLVPEPVSVVLKRSLMRIPILGWGMRLGGYIPVDRDGNVDSAKESTEAATRVLASGVHVLSFVEGTRSRDGHLQPFKKGPFYLAMHAGAPIIPISIYGTERMMKKGSLKIAPGTAHVVFHAPISPHDYPEMDDLMAAVRASIASGLPEWMRA
jgi:1-acyl-sn-glycerol-3-phosphate acyltransferase